MNDIRYATSAQKSHKTSHLIRRHERRKVARAQILPVELLPLFEWRPRPPEAAPACDSKTSYAAAKIASRYRLPIGLAQVVAELAGIGGHLR